MKIATYNVNSIRRRLPIVLDWISEHKPDVMCLQETKVQDADFPADPIRNAGYHASYRGMKAYNGVATLTRVVPETIVFGLHQGPDNDDFRKAVSRSNSGHPPPPIWLSFEILRGVVGPSILRELHSFRPDRAQQYNTLNH
jgi:exodeoxyribonuclease III